MRKEHLYVSLDGTADERLSTGTHKWLLSYGQDSSEDAFLSSRKLEILCFAQNRCTTLLSRFQHEIPTQWPFNDVSLCREGPLQPFDVLFGNIR